MIVKSKHPDVVNDVYDYFNKNIYTINNFSVEQIWFSNAIENDVYKYCSENTSDAQGATSVTNDECPKLVIILQDNLNEYDLIKVLIHEMVHAYDFTEYFEIYHNGIPGHYITDKLGFAFTLYTEFHAQYLDELRAYFYLDDKHNSKNFISFFYSSYTDSLNTFVNTLSYNSNNTPIEIRTVFVLLAKLFVWDKLTKQPTPVTSCIYSYVPQILGESIPKNWIYKVYGLLWDSFNNHHGIKNLSRLNTILEDMDFK